ncbi:MAG: ferredoxin family protein [Thermoplasmata archaeon]|nr:ferredoxin family protein [Staphylococcus epidermidis]
MVKKWHGYDLNNESWWPIIDYEKCNNCGMCLLTCGNKVFLWSENENKFIVGNPSNCVLGCTTCSKLCPVDAISFPEDPKKFILKLLMKYKIYPKIKEELNIRLKNYPDHLVTDKFDISLDPKKEFQSWHGLERKEIKWYPSIDANKCTGCGLCVVTCSEKRNVFGYDNNKKKAVVLFPYNCMIGCNNCQISCVWNAITFPELSSVRKLSKNLLEKSSELIKKEIYDKVKKEGLTI